MRSLHTFSRFAYNEDAGRKEDTDETDPGAFLFRLWQRDPVRRHRYGDFSPLVEVRTDPFGLCGAVVLMGETALGGFPVCEK